MVKVSHMENGQLYIGLSGLQLPIPKYKFPQDFENASRLQYYASFFNSIEVNSSFYKIPQARTLRRWSESVPHDFHFTFKLFKEITHCKNFAFDESLVQSFLNVIDEVGAKKACILIQLPPSQKGSDVHHLHRIITLIRSTRHSEEWNIAVEFRDRSWYHDEIFDLLDEVRCGMVFHDKAKVQAPLIDDDLPFKYVRFHGPEGNYRGTYSSDLITEYASLIRGWQDAGKTVYAYFNNTMGDAYHNALQLAKGVKAG